jgi:tRNA/tmRNA/rRNA uracil-C5-methylase (TrmA/RlmC/RlmD family)
MGGPRKTRAIRAALLSKGFIADDTHHEMFWLVVDGKKTSVRTRISHGVAEYGDNLLALIARQIGLNNRELYSLVDCPMDGERLIKILNERGKIRP